jgi:membrane-bound serine protease (ClpP class)
MWSLPVSLLLGALAAGGIILVFLLRLVMSERPRGIAAGPSRMIGLKGKAVTEVACEGRVMVQGEYWWGRARGRITEGESVRVVGIDGMTLEVEPCPDKAMIPRQMFADAAPDSDLQ